MKSVRGPVGILRRLRFYGAALWLLCQFPAEASASGVGVEVLSPAATARLPAGKPVPLRLRLAQDGQALQGAPGVFVTAVVVYPGERGDDIVRLRDDGKLGDARAGDGEWAGFFRDAAAPGSYRVVLKVSRQGRETLVAFPHPFTVVPAPPTAPPQRRPPAGPDQRHWWWTLLLVAAALVVGFAARRPRDGARREGKAPAAPRREGDAAAEPIVERGGDAAAEPMVRREPHHPDEAAALREECNRLRAEAFATRAQAAQDERRSLFQSLAQMLVQLPSVRKAVQEGADLRARDLLPLLAPLEGALRQMDIEPIGEVGALAAFDPALHQPAGQGVVLTAGQSVRIKFVGYRMGETLLRRAQVEPVPDSAVV